MLFFILNSENIEENINTLNYDKNKLLKAIAKDNNIYTLNDFEDSIRVFERKSKNEIAHISTGAFPVDMICDDKYMYVCCGDVDSVWVIDYSGNLAFLDKSINFPFCICKNDSYIAVGGFLYGQVNIYVKENFELYKQIFLDGSIVDIEFLNDDLVVASNEMYFGSKISIFSNMVEQHFLLENYVASMKIFNDFIFVVMDNNKIIKIDIQTREKSVVVCPQYEIDDFCVIKNNIYVSDCKGGNIYVYSLGGNMVGNIEIC